MMLLYDGVELVGTGSCCTRAKLSFDYSCTIRVFVQHPGACMVAPSKYERAHALVVALADLLRWHTAEVHRKSVNHSNIETGRKIGRLHASAVLHGFETDKRGVHGGRAV
jgi:hypothetical protein